MAWLSLALIGASALAAAAEQPIFLTAALFEPNTDVLSKDVRDQLLDDLARWSRRVCLDSINLNAGAASPDDDADRAAALAPRRLAQVKATIEQSDLIKPYQVVLTSGHGPASNSHGGDRIFAEVSNPRQRLPDGTCRAFGTP